MGDWYLMCLECDWFGDDSELVSLTEDMNDRDFTHCPDCGKTDFEEVEEETEDAPT